MTQNQDSEHTKCSQDWERDTPPKPQPATDTKFFSDERMELTLEIPDEANSLVNHT